MKRTFRKRLLIAGTSLAIVVLVLSLGMHPYLAITAPVGADVAVVEGWIPEPLLTRVKDEIDRNGYTSVHTTGTVRPFSYYLDQDEAIVVHLDKPMQGEVRINVSGLPGAGFRLVAGSDTVLDLAVGGHSQRYHAHLPVPVDSITIHSVNAAQAPEGMSNLYVKYFSIGRTNVHHQAGTILLLRSNGAREPGWPTFAHSSAARLHDLGIPLERLQITPAAEGQESRTLANAAGFAARARELGIKKVDVISLGVHARRSRKMYRKACGDGIEIGVIAIPDPLVARGTWWKHRMGWVGMLKEMAGVPVSNLMEVEDQAP